MVVVDLAAWLAGTTTDDGPAGPRGLAPGHPVRMTMGVPDVSAWLAGAHDDC
jgi:hypothetical protein